MAMSIFMCSCTVGSVCLLSVGPNAILTFLRLHEYFKVLFFVLFCFALCFLLLLFFGGFFFGI